jgi:glycosyltransferase involved in cell wall biosynthesis
MPTVSVIVPNYNADQYIVECLQSIRLQSYPDIELIEITDAGTGASNARNKGLLQATGDYVAFVDADDYLAPWAIEVMVDAIKDCDLVVGSFRKFGGFDQTVTHPKEFFSMNRLADYVLGNLKTPRSNQMLSGCWAKLYRREKIQPFPIITTAEDMAFNFDYLSRCLNCRFIPDIVYNNRKRKGSLSTTFNPNEKAGLFGFLEAMKYVRKFLIKYLPEDEVDDALDNSKVYHAQLYFTRIAEYMKWGNRDTLMYLYP